MTVSDLVDTSFALLSFSILSASKPDHNPHAEIESNIRQVFKSHTKYSSHEAFHITGPSYDEDMDDWVAEELGMEFVIAKHVELLK